MTERILFLDDSEERHAQFARQHPEAVREYTAWATIEALRLSPRFDVVYLDHDLGTTETGMDVVDFIVQMSEEDRPLRVVVHSYNVPAAQLRMLPALNRAGIPTTHEPFALEAP